MSTEPLNVAIVKSRQEMSRTMKLTRKKIFHGDRAMERTKRAAGEQLRAGKFRQSTFCQPQLLDTGHYRSKRSARRVRSFTAETQVYNSFPPSPLKDRYYNADRPCVRTRSGPEGHRLQNIPSAHDNTKNRPGSTEGRAPLSNGYLWRADVSANRSSLSLSK